MQYNADDFVIFPPIPFPKLSDESAWEIYDYLRCLVEAFESHYGGQIRRYLQNHEKAQIPDWMIEENEVPF